jgi:hypothetical protein
VPFRRVARRVRDESPGRYVSGSCQACLCDVEPCGGRGGVSGDGGQEVVAVERVQAGVDGRGDAGGTGDAAEQRDLAEVVALVRGRAETWRVDVELACADDVEAVTGVAGADDELAGGDGERKSRQRARSAAPPSGCEG